MASFNLEVINVNDAPVITPPIIYEVLLDDNNAASGDGSDANNAALSGYRLKLGYPDKASGMYWVKPNENSAAIEMYVDMTADGGGYDFYKVTGGTSGNDRGDTYSCPAGTDLAIPRSQSWWQAVESKYTNIYDGVAIGGIYRDCLLYTSPSPRD